MLFNQLVDAGVEAGGETAQALIDGGVATVNEVSALFAEIDSLGASLGEEVAASMYGSGVDMSNGLIAGLQSQAEALKTAAETLADGFATAFATRIDAAIADALAKLSSINAPTATGGSVSFIDTSEMPTGGISFMPIDTGVSTGAMPAPMINTFPRMPLNQTGLAGGLTMTINAGLGADGTQIGQKIVDEIIKYERSSGQVFVKA
jgi:hypothetical protein